MFEQMHDPALATLRSPVWPIEGLVQLDHLGDHRREYLEYEGSISGGRGWVKRVESGEFTLSEVGKGEWNLRLLGYPRVRVYVGSWTEWAEREELPMERAGPGS